MPSSASRFDGTPLHPVVEATLTALRTVLASTPRPTALHEPEFAGNEWRYVRDCIDTGWVSSAGEYVTRFERALAQYLDVGHAVATVNGTAALHICLILAGTRPGDEVLLPTLTFVATANAAAHCGAIPHLLDSEEATLGVDAVKLAAHLEEIAESTGAGCINRQTGRRIAALVCVHAFGHPADLDALSEVADWFGLPLIEDAAESLGSRYKGRHTATFGRLSAVSFNGNKIITTGGGGAVVTNDARLAERARHLTTTAKLPHAWAFDHDEIAYNYRLPNLNAALGLAQLEQLPRFLDAKRRLAGTYAEALAEVEGVYFFREPAFARSNYWLNLIMLDPGQADLRDALLEAAHQAGIMARPAWTPMHRLPMFRDAPRMDLTVAEDVARRVINLPSSASLAPGGGKASA